YFSCVGFPMHHAERAAVALGLLDRKPSRRKREEICRNRFGFREADSLTIVRRAARGFCTVRQRFPAGGYGELKGPARLQIGLIEARKRLMRTCGHQDRVEEIVVAIEWRIACLEVDDDQVGAGAEGGRGENQVTVLKGRVDGDAGYADLTHPADRIGLEVQR